MRSHMLTPSDFAWKWQKRTNEPLPENHVYNFSRPPLLEALTLIPVAYRVAMHNYSDRKIDRDPLFELNHALEPPNPGGYGGVPCGGIGCGTIGRGYRGDFRRWSLQPGKYHHEAISTNQFSIRIKTKYGVMTHVLSREDGSKTGSLDSWSWSIPIPDTSPSAHTGDNEYHGLFPQAWSVYKHLPTDAVFPPAVTPPMALMVTIHQVSPYIPHNYTDSCLPIAVFHVDVTCKGRYDEVLEVSVMLTNQYGNTTSIYESPSHRRYTDIANHNRTSTITQQGWEVEGDLAEGSQEHLQKILSHNHSFSIAAEIPASTAVQSSGSTCTQFLVKTANTSLPKIITAPELWSKFEQDGDVGFIQQPSPGSSGSQDREECKVTPEGTVTGAAVCIKQILPAAPTDGGDHTRNLRFTFSLSWDFPYATFDTSKSSHHNSIMSDMLAGLCKLPSTLYYIPPAIKNSDPTATAADASSALTTAITHTTASLQMYSCLSTICQNNAMIHGQGVYKGAVNGMLGIADVTSNPSIQGTYSRGPDMSCIQSREVCTGATYALSSMMLAEVCALTSSLLIIYCKYATLGLIDSKSFEQGLMNGVAYGYDFDNFLNPYDEAWEELYNFQIKYRKMYHICARALLAALNIAPTMKQYLSNGINCPSTIEGSNGKVLRDKLLQLKEQADATLSTLSTLSITNQSEMELFEVFELCNREKLNEYGYVFLSCDINKKVITACCTSGCSCGLEFMELLRSLLKESYLNGTFQDYKIQFESANLLAVDSTHALGLNDCWGTGNCVEINHSRIGCTAKHVAQKRTSTMVLCETCNKEYSKVVVLEHSTIGVQFRMISNRNPLTDKYEPLSGGALESIGRGSNDELQGDIMVYHLDGTDIRDVIVLNRYHFHSALYERQDLLMGRSVMKWGCTTNRTSGIITEISSSGICFIVSSASTGAFAHHGDSGAIVMLVTPDNSIPIGIVSSQTRKGVICYFLDPLYKLIR